MKNSELTIFVYFDSAVNGLARLGKLYAVSNRGTETFSFEYDSLWLEKHQSAMIFDPDLSLYGGRQYAPLDKSLFGIFSDSCPDRWGRSLMNRREAMIARQMGRKPHVLTESDYLLGVLDQTRMGALRFSMEENGPFLSYDTELAAPPWVTLRSLENASMAFEKGTGMNNEKWLRQLIAPGSSLGGARPKASIMGQDGSLWIAKFPSKHDEWNSGAWEMVAHKLAALCGLNVPDAKLETFSDAGSTFLVKRFDRIGDKRIHYASAMTLLGKTDHSEGNSYLDIAAFIRSNGDSPKADLAELWKRIVFSICISNNDDHLRNHGFLLNENGWRLSPMFDVNPNIYGDALSLNISETDNTIDIGLAIETAGYYGISHSEAKILAGNISDVVKNEWKRTADNLCISKGDIQRMAPAFTLSN